MPKTATSTKVKKPSIFLVASPTGNRLIRGESASVVRQHLFGEIKISKASGDDVASFLEAGNSIEEAAAPAAHAPDTSAPETPAPETPASETSAPE